MDGNWMDVFGKLRYGIGTSEKEALARGVIAAAIKDRSASQSKADRMAAGYLFQKNWPRLAPKVQPLVDAARIGWFGDSPEEQSYATLGANMAKIGRKF